MMDIDNLSFDEEESMEVNDSALPMGRHFGGSCQSHQPLYQPKCSSLTTHQRSRLLEDIGLDSNSSFEMKSAVVAEPIANDDLRSLVHHFTSSVQGLSLATSSSTSEPSCRCPGSKCRFSQFLSSPTSSSSARNNLDVTGHGLARSLSNSTSSLVAVAGPKELSYNLSASSLALQASGTTPPTFLSHCIKHSGSSDAPVGRRNTMPSRQGPPPHSGRSLPPLPPNSPPELKEAQQDFIQNAGGVLRVSRVFHEFMEMVGCMPELLCTTRRDKINLLMALCCEPLSKHGDNTLLYLHIFVVIMAMTEQDPSGNLLFTRNSQEASALDLAALTNKSVVVRYLGLLYHPLDHDLNEANAQGHTILHLMARKGDEAADSLETLLKLKANGKRLLRIDVLNGGAKTPLDVANACNDMFQKNEVSYSQVIRLFHDTIDEQVNELYQTEEEQLQHPNEL